MKTLKRFLIVLSLLFIPLLASEAHATVFLVVNAFDNSVDANGSLRTRLIEACNNAGDDEINFDLWSASHPSNKVITLDSPLVIPSNCQGKITLKGRDDDPVDVTLNGSNIPADQCALDIQSSGNQIQKINVINSPGKGICVHGNGNNLAQVRVGYQFNAGTVGANAVGVEITGNNNNLYESIIVASTSHGVVIHGDHNQVTKNFIGTTIDNENATSKVDSFGNGGDGVQIEGSYNIVGGSTGLKNWIGFNDGRGISITGANSQFNNLGFNTIYNNGLLGIDLGANGVTQMDETDSCSSGPNACLKFPFHLRTVQYGTNNWAIQGLAPENSEVQCYLVNAGDNDTNGEGQKFLGKINLSENNSSDYKSFSFLINGTALVNGAKVSCLTSRGVEKGVNTSEFSGVTTLGDPGDDPRPPPEGPTPVCGNGTVETGEQCDDNNTANGDCCSSTCQFESAASSCSDNQSCTVGDHCDGAGACVPGSSSTCGNGTVDASCNEECDDHNTMNGDGCDSTCHNEPRCGDGHVNGTEQCDDGNTTNGDCCDSTCHFEASGSTCTDNQTCTVGDHCDGAGTCVPGGSTTCGNGTTEAACNEQCDDHNTTSGDGCDSMCHDEVCNHNGTLEGTEVCDDGNTTNGDGCDNNCTVTACGNGVQTAGEECDDGNTMNGDGCSAACQISGPPPFCGNGNRDGFEECDDGNHTNGDGCDNNCKETRCGNGVITGREVCDDGNTVSGDGCSRNCEVETIGRCGDYIINIGEQCDDGNRLSGDFCSSDCQVEVEECGPPTDLIATAVSSSQINLTWVDRCSYDIGFWVERADGECAVATNFTQIATVGVNITTYQDTDNNHGLHPNTYYCYRVRAFYPGFRASPYTNLDDAKTFADPTTIPNPPSWLIATALSSTEIQVNWIDNANNETAFELWRSVGDCSNFTFLTDTIPANTTSYIDPGLTPDTLYCYKIRAKNPVGNSAFSNADDARTFPLPTDVPNPATNLDATAVSSTQINVKWDDNANNEDGYELERSIHPTCDPTTFVFLATLGVNATSYSDTGLTPSTKYCYRVRPFNSRGRGAYSNIDDATTFPVPTSIPTDPINLAATGVTSSRIDVVFTDRSDNEEGFILERADGACADNNPFAAIASLLANPGVGGTVTYRDLGLPANTTFCYRVKAYNSVGSSAYSNKDDGSTLPVPTDVPLAPIDLQADATGPHEIKVTFNDNSSNEDFFVMQRADGLCAANAPFASVAIIPAVAASGSQVIFLDRSVDDGKSYCYRVFAHNFLGDSEPSNKDDATTPPEGGCTAGDIDADNICDDAGIGTDPGEGPPGTDTDQDGTPDAGDTDTDGDGIPDVVEAGDPDINTPPVDTDSDGTPDFRDKDSDGDCVFDSVEGNVDTDGDGKPDFRDTDSDGDGVFDGVTEGASCHPIDNCRINPNVDQKDADNDGIGDVCDPTPNPGPSCAENDTDCDGIPNESDNCPTVANPGQEDADQDGIGDVCDTAGGPSGSLEGSGCSLHRSANVNFNAMLPFAMLLLPGIFLRIFKRRS